MFKYSMLILSFFCGFQTYASTPTVSPLFLGSYQRVVQQFGPVFDEEAQAGLCPEVLTIVEGSYVDSLELKEALRSSIFRTRNFEQSVHGGSSLCKDPRQGTQVSENQIISYETCDLAGSGGSFDGYFLRLDKNPSSGLFDTLVRGSRHLESYAKPEEAVSREMSNQADFECVYNRL